MLLFIRNQLYSSLQAQRTKSKFLFCSFCLSDRCEMVWSIKQILIAMGNEGTKAEGLFERNEKKSGYQQLKGDMEDSCKCSYKTRVTGWIVCFLIGWVISLLSTIVFILKHNTTVFAVFYSLGQVLNIAGSCFLSTPKTQWKDMWKETRWLLTLCYLGFLILTLVLAFVLPDNLKVLVIVSMILQMISYFLYTLSYVPFGRKLIKRFCKCLFSEE